MAERIPFRLKLTGGTADRHEFQGYDGYMAMAGFARTLSLVANYSETGKIRQRGEYVGREAVVAQIPRSGSVVADFLVTLHENPLAVLAIGNAAAVAPFFYSLVRRIVESNVGPTQTPALPAVETLSVLRSGDVETLTSIAEAPIRQTHQVIGHGASKISIVGVVSVLANFTPTTKEYIQHSDIDPSVILKEVSVSAFNVNSGNGSVYDPDLGRTVAIQVPSEILSHYRSVLTWGLDQYAKQSGAMILLEFTRILAADGRAKKYIVISARM